MMAYVRIVTQCMALRAYLTSILSEASLVSDWSFETVSQRQWLRKRAARHAQAVVSES